MLEVGDAEEEALLQEGVLLQGVGHLQGEAPHQDVEEVLMMEVDPGGEEVEEVKTGALQEGDRLQGEVPLLVGALHHAVALLQEERGAAVMEVPGGEEEEEVEDLHLEGVLHQEGGHPHAAMDLPAMKAHQTGDVTVQQGTIELLQDPMTVHLLPNPMTELLQNPLDSLMRAGPRWPSVKPTWTSRLGRLDFQVSLAPPW